MYIYNYIYIYGHPIHIYIYVYRYICIHIYIYMFFFFFCEEFRSFRDLEFEAAWTFSWSLPKLGSQHRWKHCRSAFVLASFFSLRFSRRWQRPLVEKAPWTLWTTAECLKNGLHRLTYWKLLYRLTYTYIDTDWYLHRLIYIYIFIARYYNI